MRPQKIELRLKFFKKLLTTPTTEVVDRLALEKHLLLIFGRKRRALTKKTHPEKAR